MLAEDATDRDFPSVDSLPGPSTLADLDRFVGDAAHLELTPEQMLSDSFIAARRALLNPNRAERMEPGPSRTRSETVYLTTADAEGNMVSFINSVYEYFGSGVVVPGTGFALHNRGAGFTLTPGVAVCRRRGTC